MTPKVAIEIVHCRLQRAKRIIQSSTQSKRLHFLLVPKKLILHIADFLSPSGVAVLGFSCKGLLWLYKNYRLTDLDRFDAQIRLRNATIQFCTRWPSHIKETIGVGSTVQLEEGQQLQAYVKQLTANPKHQDHRHEGDIEIHSTHAVVYCPFFSHEKYRLYLLVDHWRGGWQQLT